MACPILVLPLMFAVFAVFPMTRCATRPVWIAPVYLTAITVSTPVANAC